MLLMIGTSDEVVCEFFTKSTRVETFFVFDREIRQLEIGLFLLFFFTSKNNTSAQTSSYQFVSHRYKVTQ